MKNRKKVVLRYNNIADLEAKLVLLGVQVHQPVDGETLQIEGHFERCNTPELVATNGTVISVLASPESAVLMQDIMPPEVLVDFVDGEMQEVLVDGVVTEQPIPWPEYQVSDGEGGFATQGAGTFQL